jgi:hypothetical protein
MQGKHPDSSGTCSGAVTVKQHNINGDWSLKEKGTRLIAGQMMTDGKTSF